MLSAAERHQRACVEFDDAKDNELTAEHALTANMAPEGGGRGLVGSAGETVLENWNRATQRVGAESRHWWGQRKIPRGKAHGPDFGLGDRPKNGHVSYDREFWNRATQWVGADSGFSPGGHTCV